MTDESAELLGSLLLFTQHFFRQRTGNNFNISRPPSREPHQIQICRMLMKVFRGEVTRLFINIEPRSGKTEFLINFMGFCLAHYSRCKFIYTSYSSVIATKQTESLRELLMLREYQKLFPDTKVSQNSSAKDDFKTTTGGEIFAVGESGSLTGRGAGVKGVTDRFTGAIIIDDILKPAEAASDSVRQARTEWFTKTLLSRRNNGDQTPIIAIGQRLHEDDMFGHIIDGKLDGYKWDGLILPSLDDDNNILIPENESAVRGLERISPYEFAAQYQQNPVPAGGGIFKKDWFIEMPIEPQIIASFITVDCAETQKAWNDATVFSFFGVYRIEQKGVSTEFFGLHWIDCMEIRVEPHELEGMFLEFWSECMSHYAKPHYVYPEKKSTGTTLASVLTKVRGMIVIPIERGGDQNKIARFLGCQPYIKGGQVSFTQGAKHVKDCKDHMSKITANNSHRHDDIADTLADGINIALIAKSLPLLSAQDTNKNLEYMAKRYNQD